MRDVFICDAVRTPIGRYAGALAKVRMLEIEGVATEPPPAAQTAFEF